MKIFYLLFFAVFCLSFSGSYYPDLKPAISNNIDSSIIIHKQDGKTEEWQADKFSANEEYDIRYAFDNDEENLYLALEIKDQNEQIKMMRLGMNLYFDLKGKKSRTWELNFH